MQHFGFINIELNKEIRNISRNYKNILKTTPKYYAARFNIQIYFNIFKMFTFKITPIPFQHLF